MDQSSDPNFEHAYYLETVMRTHNLRESVDLVKKALQGYDFDAIAFRGMSGALIAPTVALEMNKQMIMVRKGDDGGPDATHSYNRVEGFKGSRRYIILDDLISSGNTVTKIVQAVAGFAPHAELVGMLGYYSLNFKRIEEEIDNRRGATYPHNLYPLQYPSDLERTKKGYVCRWTWPDWDGKRAAKEARVEKELVPFNLGVKPKVAMDIETVEWEPKPKTATGYTVSYRTMTPPNFKVIPKEQAVMAITAFNESFPAIDTWRELESFYAKEIDAKLAKDAEGK